MDVRQRAFFSGEASLCREQLGQQLSCSLCTPASYCPSISRSAARSQLERRKLIAANLVTPIVSSEALTKLLLVTESTADKQKEDCLVFRAVHRNRSVCSALGGPASCYVKRGRIGKCTCTCVVAAWATLGAWLKSSKLLVSGHSPDGRKKVRRRLLVCLSWLTTLSPTFAFPEQRRPWRGEQQAGATTTTRKGTEATTSEPQLDALPMDITVRVEVQYHAPANAVTRDVLEMFRSTTWVRFMMRYVSPRLKSSSPADQAILDELESQDAAEVHKGEECVICMSENPCDGHVALPCGHTFHYPCISSWLQSQSTCPVCRFQFPKAFTGKYAVLKLKSSMVLAEEQTKMPRAELLALDIGKEVVRAVVSVTLVKVVAEGDDEEFPCELSAWMLDPSTGETFSELDCILQTV